MQLSQLLQGAAARGEVEFALVTGETVKAGLRVLLGAQEALVLERAQAFAVKRGTPVERAGPGNALYELGYEVATVVLGLVDADDPAGERPFFDGGAEQVLEHLDVDRVALLYERHRAFQDRCSPRPSSMSAEAFYAKVVELVQAEADDDRPFDSLRPAIHRSFTRTMARQLWASLTAKSPPGWPSGPSTSGATDPSPTAEGAEPSAGSEASP